VCEKKTETWGQGGFFVKLLLVYAGCLGRRVLLEVVVLKDGSMVVGGFMGFLHFCLLSGGIRGGLGWVGGGGISNSVRTEPRP